MNDSPAPLLFAPTETHTLGVEIARHTGLELAPLEERDFEAGEFKLRPLVSVRDRTVFVLQSLAGSTDASVTQRLVRLLFLLFGLRDAGASRLIALVPYLSYARQDQRTRLDGSVNTRYVAQLLESTGLDRLVTLDVHNPAALDNAFRIPTDHLSAMPMFVDHFAAHLPPGEIAVASPDIGGVKRAQVFRELLQARLGREIDLVFIEKRRTRDAVSGGAVVGEVTGRTVLVLDDMCASGETLIRAATALREAGAADVQVAFTHAPLPRGLAALAATECISRAVFTDSVGSALHAESVSNAGRLTVLPIAPLFGDAVRAGTLP